MWVVPFPSVSLNRLALSPFTFSNGMTAPAGTDERIYANADGFDGFRFTELRESEGYAPTSRHHGHMVSTSTEQLSFGLGRHACPGRFFAANEVKALFAHILVTYEFKLGTEKETRRK
ncbi:cytochrome P450 [Russula brevipes]|nr:cytochrome P450 [Russula brevipes]